MRAFVLSFLFVSLLAAGANAHEKKVEKRGVFQETGRFGNGVDVSGSGVSSGVLFGGQSVATSAKYLPPVSTVAVVKKPVQISAYTPSVASQTYNVQTSVPSHGYTVGSVPSYTHPVAASVPSYSHSVGASAPTFAGGVVSAPVTSYSHAVPAPVPSYSHAVSAPVSSYSHHAVSSPLATSVVQAPIRGHAVDTSSFSTLNTHAAAPAPVYSHAVSVPTPTYGVPAVHHSGPVYASRAPVSSGPVSLSLPVSSGFSSGFSLGHGSVSGSYGVPSPVVPSVGVSVSKSYGVPQVDGGLSVAHHAVGFGGDLSTATAHLPSTSYGVPSHVSTGGVQVGQTGGYAYPAPTKKLVY